MKRGCILSLLLYGACVSGYYFAFESRWDPPATWIGPLVAGTILFFSLGALLGGWQQFRDWSLLERARLGLPWRDGRPAVAAGTIHPVGQPLQTPFSHSPAVLYEYEMRRRPRLSGDDSPVATALGGFRMEPWLVREGNRTLRVFGFPDLAELPPKRCSLPVNFQRASAFLAQRRFENVSGLRLVQFLSSYLRVLADDDGSIEQDWQRDPDALAWLASSSFQAPPIAAPGNVDSRQTGNDEDEITNQDDEDSFDDEDDDDDSLEDQAAEDQPHDSDQPGGDSAEGDDELLGSAGGDRPELIEKFIAPGSEACVFGIYREDKNALVPSLKRSTVVVRYLPGPADVVAGRLRQAAIARVVGGLIALVLLHLTLWGGTQLHVHHPSTLRRHHEALARAAENGDLAEITRLIECGVDPNSLDRGRESLLFGHRPEVVRLLLEKGANPNQTTSSGETPLMRAARQGQVEIVRALLAAGADVNVKHGEYRTTALMQAIDAQQVEISDLLRAAGAADDTVTAGNGLPIDPTRSPAAAVVVEYLKAIHAAEPARLKQLSSSERPADFDDVDWQLWHDTRPIGDLAIAGFAQENSATIRVEGPTPKGYFTTWVFQVVREAGEWKILRESWRVR